MDEIKNDLNNLDVSFAIIDLTLMVSGIILNKIKEEK